MEILLNIISFITLAISYKCRKFRHSLLTIFCGLWFLICFLYSFKFYDIYDVKTETLLMYTLGILFYFAGYVTYKGCRKKRCLQDSKYKRRVKILKLLAILSIFVLVQKAILAIPIWLSGGVGDLKSDIVENNVLGLDPISEIIYTFVARPLIMVFVIYSVILILQRHKEKSVFFLTFLMILLGYVCTGSKFMIVEVILMSLTYIFIFNYNSIFTIVRRNRKLFVIILLIICVLYILLSAKGEGLNQSLYSYVCGCIPCSDNALDSIKREPPFWGVATFNGFLRIFSLPLSLIGFPELKSILDLVFSYMLNFEETMMISPTIKYNAFISLFSYFYADGGLLGVVFISFIYGNLSNRICSKAISSPTYMNVSLLLFTSFLIYTSMVRANTFMVYYVLPYFYIYFLIPRKPLVIIKTRKPLVIIKK